MFLRNLRWVAAGLLAVVAALATPARSDAAVQVLIEQYFLSGDNAGATVGPTVILSQNGNGFLTFSTNSSSAWANDTSRHFDVGVLVTTNSGSPTTDASLGVKASALTTSSFDGSRGLRLIVTDDGFAATAGFPSAFVQNSAGANNSLPAPNGTPIAAVTAESTTQLFQTPLPTVPVDTRASSTTNMATGTVIPGSVTPNAVNTNPGSFDKNSTSTFTGQPLDTYAIQQIIKIYTNAQGPIGPFQEFGGAFGASVTLTTPVPAPAGLVLALTALPVFGLRRWTRRKNGPAA